MRDYVTGEVYGSDRRPDGTRIVTTALVSRDDRCIVTSSGDRYILEGQEGVMDAAPGFDDATSCTR